MTAEVKDAIAAVNAMLLGNTAMVALVDEDSIEPAQLSEGTPVPALVLAHLNTLPGPHLNVKESTYEALRSRVQLTAYAETYPQLKAVLATVRQACANRRGSIGGVAVRNCRVAMEGVDGKTPDDALYTQTIDLLVDWVRAL